MKILFVFFVLANLSHQLTKQQFDDIHFHQDYFGKVEKVIYLSNSQICLINKKGFKQINLDTQETLYFVTQNIEQLQLLENNKLLIKSKNEILKYDMLSGKLISKIKPKVQDFKQFLFIKNNFYFLKKNSIVIQNTNGEIEEKKTDQNLNSIMYQSELKNFLISTEPNGSIYSLSEDIQDYKATDLSIKLFSDENKFDQNKFILTQKDQGQNLKQIIDRILFSQIDANENYKIMKTKKGLEIMNGSAEEILTLDSKDLTEQPLKMFTNGKLFIVQSKLLTLEIFRINPKEKIYQSEESLAEIKQIEFFTEHDTREHYNNFLAYDNLIKKKQILQAWKERFKINTAIIKETFTHFCDVTKEFFLNIKNGNYKNLSNILKNQDSSLQSQIAIILTESGKVFKFNLKKRKFENQLKIYIKNLEIKKEHDQVFSVGVKNSEQIEFYDLNFQNLQNNKKNEAAQQHYQFKVNLEKHNLEGYYKGQAIWEIIFEENEEIVKYQKMQDTKIPKNSFITEKNFVLYKLIDPNNFILVTKTEESHNVYIINSKYGKILGQYSINIPSDDFQLLVDDNSFFVVYYDRIRHLGEIVHFELFRTKFEKELIPIITASWNNYDQKLEEIDYNAADSEYYLLQKNYGIDLIPKKIFAFDSINDLTSKNLLILTKDDKIYSISRKLLSTRRCLAEEKEKALKNIQRSNEKKIKRENFYKSQILPDYEYKLQITEKELVSGNLDLKNVDQIFISPSIYESTSDLIISGQSFLAIQHSPNQLFDKLPNSFDKLKLIGFLTFMVVVYFILKVISKKKAKYKNFDTN